MLRIDSEFNELLEPLTQDEYNLLEKSILSIGCRVPIDVWIDPDSKPSDCKNCHSNKRGYDLELGAVCWVWICKECGHGHEAPEIIIDGHNRYEICQKHNIDYETKEIEFDTRDDAILWIIDNQGARRNSSLYQKGVVALTKKAILAKKAKENQIRKPESVLMNSSKQLEPINTRKQLAEEAGMAEQTLSRIEKIHKESSPEIIQSIRDGELTINKAYTQIVNEERNKKEKQLKESLEAVPLPNKIYDVVVIDPPWDMQKILRDVAPNQKEFDYPTMTIDEIKTFPIKDLVADNCHVFLWTTQKYLPSAFDIINEWGLTYVLTMVWHKNGGFQPFGLPQYNCEFVLYAHKGNPKFIDTKAFNCCFNGERGKHSEKPNEFYQLLDRVCDGNKIDIFARKEREGWSVYGNEVI